MTFRIRYIPDTDLALRFPSTKYPWRGPGIPTREQAEKVRAACPNVEAMEVYEVEDE